MNLEPFTIVYNSLLKEDTPLPIRRLLSDEIDWSARLIAITGGRGVGKTDFVLAHARELEVQHNLQSYLGKEHEYTPCLYVNLSDFFFTEHTILEFTTQFAQDGGKTLIFDQTYKYPLWAEELKQCYDQFPQLHIIFVAATVMDIDTSVIKDIVAVYNLRGLSFREYLNLQCKTNLPAYSLEDILKNHVGMALDINGKVNPQQYFDAYLRHGYYPSYLGQSNFMGYLTRIMNMVLDTDILIVKQINSNCIFKLRKLLYVMLSTTPGPCNISKIAEIIDASRATTLNYIVYMREARLLNLLYTVEKKAITEELDLNRKPMRVYMQNTNLAYTLSDRFNDIQGIAETFFYNTIHARHKLNAPDRNNATFLVDGRHYFNVYNNVPRKDTIQYSAIYNMNIGYNNFIPLWLFGFLY